MDELNTEQRRAAEAGDGPVLIVAGPGTGKTKTLTARITYLLETGVKPNEMVALTFTNKAAREMRERLGGQKALPKICTFHALGADLLQSDRQLLKPAEQQEIIRALTRPAAFKSLSLRELMLVISRAKTSLQKPDEATLRLLQRYEAAKAEKGLHDFDDLLAKAYELLQTNERKRPNYTHVLVDEFQDTSALQYELLKLLGAGENVFAIGDPNQSIYGWRGAGAEMFASFRADFPNLTEITLSKNYRSRPEVVRLANAIFPDSPQLVAQIKQAGSVRALQTLNEYSEAAYVLSEIEKGIGGSTLLNAQEDAGRQPRDYAVLYRTHQAGKVLQKAFRDSGIPHQIAGEGSPYERPEVQAVIAALRTAANPGGLSVCDLAEHLAAQQGIDSEHVSQLLGLLVQFGGDTAAALRHLDEIAEQEFYDPSVNAVTLMTIHASKGLEFEHVFLIAAEDGILPKEKGENIDEERRLFYVAATRAKETLEIIYTKTRAGQPAKASRFIHNIPLETLPRGTDPDMHTLEKRLQKRTAKRAQTSLF